jgi:hypothetical protein
MIPVGGWLDWISTYTCCETSTAYQIVIFRSVLLEKRVAGEVCGIATGSEDDGTVLHILWIRQP